MRIGIDCRTVDADGSGVGQYGAHIVKALGAIDPENEFFLLRPQGRSFPFLTAHLGMRKIYEAVGCDLIHVPGGAAPFGYRKPYVLTVHDLAIYRHPEWFPGGQWFSTSVSYPSSIRNARRIIVPSEVTKRDLIELMKIDAGKIVVVPHGVEVPRLLRREAPRNDEKYILFLGTIEPRKNIQMLIAAYRMMIDAHPELKDVELRIAGAIGWKAGPILRDIEEAQRAGYAVEPLGRVSEEEKWNLLAGASCFVFPSFYEGFGMPILEAMAAGTPVVCSDIAVHREVAGDAAAFFDLNTSEAVASKVYGVISDKKIADDLREKGSRRAIEFSWEKCARQTIEVYKSSLRA